MPDPVDIEEGRRVVEQMTPGKWHWSGYKDSRSGPYLATWLPGQGRCTVMDFVRLGMHGAQPRFASGGLMVNGVALAVQEVEYRKDVVDIDHPDAQGIVWLRNNALALLALAEQPCPHVVTSDEGTSYCDLDDSSTHALLVEEKDNG